MRYLVDTHVLLWALSDPVRLSKRATAILSDPFSELIVSAATSWEIAIKHRAGKLPGAEALLLSYAEQLSRFRVTELPLSSRHTLAAGQLEWNHRDPFDRALAAQSILEAVPLISSDPAFRELPGLTCVWD